MSGNITVYVVSHDQNDIDQIVSDDVYTPLFVGCNGKENFGYCSDDTGDNISNKNNSYCELTGLYWMWKNAEADIIGLVHYRRYFAKNKHGKRLNKQDIETFLGDYDIILPKRTNSLFGSVYNDYAHWNYGKDLDLCGEVISELFPEYSNSFDKVMNGDSLYYYNMFIAPKNIISGYCEWVFPILSEVEKRVDMTGYDNYQKRIYGFLTERLFDVWMDKQDLKVKECDLKVLGRLLNIKNFIAKRWIVRQLYVKFYVGMLHKDAKR